MVSCPSLSLSLPLLDLYRLTGFVKIFFLLFFLLVSFRRDTQNFCSSALFFLPLKNKNFQLPVECYLLTVVWFFCTTTTFVLLNFNTTIDKQSQIDTVWTGSNITTITNTNILPFLSFLPLCNSFFSSSKILSTRERKRGLLAWLDTWEINRKNCLKTIFTITLQHSNTTRKNKLHALASLLSNTP